MELKMIQANDEYTHVALSGRLDIDGVRAVELDFAAIVGNKGKSAIVDMTEVSFMASLGMRMLLSTAKTLRAAGGKVVLYNPQPVVLEALETAGFSAVMSIESDFAKALELIQSK
ncbi:MAG: STAS domain-containing protein [Lentisphaeria bacterium]|nr:STAS domain-containing protein [Lentisphaeria bacterium]